MLTAGMAVNFGKIGTIGGKYVRSTRFVSIGAGTSGTVTLPPNSTVILNDFGGTVDAIVTQISSGSPLVQPAFDTTGAVVSTTFDSSGNWAFSSAPASYPVAIIYRVQQKLSDFDSTSSDIWGEPGIDDDSASPVAWTPSWTLGTPANIKLNYGQYRMGTGPYKGGAFISFYLGNKGTGTLGSGSQAILATPNNWEIDLSYYTNNGMDVSTGNTNLNAEGPYLGDGVYFRNGVAWYTTYLTPNYDDATHKSFKLVWSTGIILDSDFLDNGSTTGSSVTFKDIWVHLVGL